jgi:predicted nucleic acid-binding protein
LRFLIDTNIFLEVLLEQEKYVIAEKYGLTIISFDSDFDRTERGRTTPGIALKK